MDEGKIRSGEIELHYIAEGPTDGEPVLLLHGFPQFSYCWRHQLKALGEAGYRAVAPDLRGYNLSDRPEKVEDYKMQHLVGDVGAFYKAFGWSKANLVVHDWGGAIGWVFAGLQPKLVKRFVAVDMPHGAAFHKAQNENIEQVMKSWYIWLFQAPEAAENFFGKNEARNIVNWVFRNPFDRNIFSKEDLEQYRQMLNRPGQLTAAFNYYRANFAPQTVFTGQPSQQPKVEVPTLLMYGTQDLAFASTVWEDTANYCTGPFRLVPLEGVGHWAPEQAPEEVTRLILEHIKD